jgi:hypothetical protein
MQLYFNDLNHCSYFPNQEQYGGIHEVFQQSFLLLKAMARENETVQQRLFDRLDMMLNIQGAEAEMADALIEVFKTVEYPSNNS